MPHDAPLVLVLGAGINGCAIARELALGGVGVCLVDRGDIASGATAYSSRLIHGGLRYLEYGEFDLVRESLTERGRLLRLAPQFVRPLELVIPVGNRLGGWWSAALRLLSGGRLGGSGSADDGGTGPAIEGAAGSASAKSAKSRGLWLVRIGLWLYDRYARDKTLPGHAAHRVGDRGTPPVDARAYRWLCSYWDAQVEYPERLTLALLEDARIAAAAAGASFVVLNYHRARRDGRAVELLPVASGGRAALAEPFGAALAGPLGVALAGLVARRWIEPDLIVNATGASVDRALAELEIESPPLMGPTKGSHLVTRHRGLIDALGGRGIYAEASDGRPVFILPLGDAVLVGTTDIPFDDPPETAVASEDELDYLTATVAGIFPTIGFTRGDIDFHYSGVRPLPRSDAASPAGVTRRHAVVEHSEVVGRESIRRSGGGCAGRRKDPPPTKESSSTVPVVSVIGGKLTTCRALAEVVADRVLEKLGRARIATTAERPLPGGENYPAGPDELAAAWRELTDRFSLGGEQVAAIWKLLGTRTTGILETIATEPGEYGPLDAALDGCAIPEAVARWSIRHEWPRSVADLVERRLMLLYHAPLTRRCLQRLAELLAEAGAIAPADVGAETERTVHRLAEHYGKQTS